MMDVHDDDKYLTSTYVKSSNWGKNMKSLIGNVWMKSLVMSKANESWNTA